jgi:hypothetical protein
METGSMKERGSTGVGARQASVNPASSQATASTIAHKYRRALKNGTGAHLTLAELQLLAHLGALDLVTRAENEELTNWQEILARMPSANTGSTNAAMVKPPASGRLPQSPPTDDRSYIKALGLAT